MKGKIFSVLVVSFILALFTRLFIFEGFVVMGDSMLPTISSGEYVFVNKLAYSLDREPKKGDIVVADSRMDHRLIKRVEGLPREKIEVDGKKFQMDPQEYFLLGDNREVSIDSRIEGPVDKWQIKGKVLGSFSFKTFKYKDLR